MEDREEITTAVSVPARDLRHHLKALLPHVSRADMLPDICGIRIEVRRGVLSMAATDRYTLAATQMPASPGPLPVADGSAFLSREAAKSVRRLLKGADGHASVLFEGDELRVDVGSDVYGHWRVTRTDLPIDWRSLIAKWTAAPACELGDGFGIGAAKLARFAVDVDSDPFSNNPLSIRIVNTRHEHQKPPVSPMLLVARGAWFVGCVMPVRLSDGSAPDWSAWAAPEAVPAEVPEPAMAAAGGGDRG